MASDQRVFINTALILAHRPLSVVDGQTDRPVGRQRDSFEFWQYLRIFLRCNPSSKVVLILVRIIRGYKVRGVLARNGIP